ncbi:MAG: cytochrome c [Hyphomonadaceae bacterium]
MAKIAASMAMMVIIGAAFVLSACATGEQSAPRSAAPDAARVERGHQIAVSNCSSCHAIGSSGESRHPMAPPFRHLSQNYSVNQLEEAFAEGVLVGHPDMPEFTLAPEDIDALLSYLQSVQERQGA